MRDIHIDRDTHRDTYILKYRHRKIYTDIETYAETVAERERQRYIHERYTYR